MKYIYPMESLLISVAFILCSVLLMKLLYKLRSALPWRVNCWFCNNYFWVKYPNRNSWMCRTCDQYNGFTKDGDYNKPVTAFSDKMDHTPKRFKSSPPKNGLCKMCNINQQLKVTQLANFVPMNDKNYDEEIETYRLQLEKAYKLCTPCKNVLQVKLHKEKQTLLGSKLLASRTPEKRKQNNEIQYKALKKFINNTSFFIAVILLMLVSFEFCTHLTLRYQNLLSTKNNIKEIVLGLLERMYSIIEMKTSMTFPSLRRYFYDIHIMNLMPKSFDLRHLDIDQVNLMTQKTLGSFVCFLQTIGLIWNVNSMKNTIVIDSLWLVFVAATVGLTLEPIYLSSVKVICTVLVIMLYKFIKRKNERKPTVIPTSPKRMKNLINGPVNTSIANVDDQINLDTDDDVSLSKFGVHNFSESSNEIISPLNSSLMNGRAFTPRTDSLWTKPKLNSTFCINPVICKSPSSISDTVFVKPSFNSYQKLANHDSDSELDESISSLCIGSPKKSKKKTNSIFSLRKFSTTPCFVAPTPMTRARPLISPSKLGHGTSWVAGGYWGSDSERQLFSVDGSRSSSQSSGFESQTSSMNQRNIFSQCPSREESICGEPMVMDRYPTNNTFSMFQSPQNFSRVISPVYPQMQYNSHVHIPQPRLAQQYSVPMSPNAFAAQSCVQTSMFKTPNGSGLSKFQAFTSR